MSVLLGLKRMKARHTGEDIAEVILPILHHYDIINKIGVWVADNANSNDTTIKAILKVIDSRIKDISPYQSRCLGHIINLATKAFLFDKEIDAFKAITGRRHDPDGLYDNEGSAGSLALKGTDWQAS